VGTLWIVFLGIGTIALGLILWLATMRNRKHEAPSEIARTEAATHRLYEEEDAEDHKRDVQR
jgi:hypothetical protein